MFGHHQPQAIKRTVIELNKKTIITYETGSQVTQITLDLEGVEEAAKAAAKRIDEALFKNKQYMEERATALTGFMRAFRTGLNDLVNKAEIADSARPPLVFPVSFELEKFERARDSFKNVHFPCLRSREKEFFETSQKEFLSKKKCDDLLSLFDVVSDALLKNNGMENSAVSIATLMVNFKTDLMDLVTKIEDADFTDPKQVFPISLELQRLKIERDKFKDEFFPHVRRKMKEFSETSAKAHFTEEMFDDLLGTYDVVNDTFNELKPQNNQKASLPLAPSTPDTSPERERRAASPSPVCR